MTLAHKTVVDFFDLYTSERRELAKWLGVERTDPKEKDFDFGSRVIMRAREMNKVDEFTTKVAALKSARR